jgi:hypothetical protein
MSVPKFSKQLLDESQYTERHLAQVDKLNRFGTGSSTKDKRSFPVQWEIKTQKDIFKYLVSPEARENPEAAFRTLYGSQNLGSRYAKGKRIRGSIGRVRPRAVWDRLNPVGSPQGAPTSPIFSNVILKVGLYDKMKEGNIIVGYADDGQILGEVNSEEIKKITSPSHGIYENKEKGG